MPAPEYSNVNLMRRFLVVHQELFTKKFFDFLRILLMTGTQYRERFYSQ